MMQAALLAGLPQAPSLYDPFLAPETALERRDRRAAARCYDERRHLAATRYQAALRDTSLHLKPGPALHDDPRAVLLQLRARPADREVRRADRRSRAACASTRRSTRRFQRAARKAITDTLYLKDDPAAALVSINPANGAIRAMTVGLPRADARTSSTSSRRPGGRPARRSRRSCSPRRSTQGIEPGDHDLRLGAVPLPAGPRDRRRGTSRPTATPTRARSPSQQATLQSDNTVYAQLTLDVGPENVAAMAHKLGVQSPLSRCPRSGSARTRSRRSTWPRRTRRSPPAGSTRSRWRSAG